MKLVLLPVNDGTHLVDYVNDAEWENMNWVTDMDGKYMNWVGLANGKTRPTNGPHVVTL